MTAAVKDIKDYLVSPQRLVGIILAVILIVAIFTSPYFLKARNLRNVFLIQPIGLGLASMGQAFVVIAGGIDLSVGSAISLLTSIGAGIFKARPDISPLVVIAALLGLGAAMGALNGFIVVKLRVTPIMATLATMMIYKGMVLFYTKRTIGGIPSAFRFISDGRIFGIPFSIVMFAGMLLLCYLVLNRNRIGKHIYAVGADAEVSRLSGINVAKTKFVAFLIGGILVGLASVFLAARLGGGGPEVGNNYELDTIAAIVIGGVSLAGGSGNLLSAFGGVLIITIFSNLMNLLGLNPFLQIVLKGLVLIFAVAFYSKQRVG
jgi:ribose transport system permease protein